MKSLNGLGYFEVGRDKFEELYPHQREALKWLWRLHCNGTGGLFADDMGLGKTRVVLVFLLGLFQSRMVKRAIIIVPSTITTQWERATSDIGLQCNICTFSDAKLHREDLDDIMKHGGLLITTYDALRKNHELVMGVVWNYIFADEGHRLKNPEAKISEILNKIKCDHKIVVTGTPVQNNLMEFYALVQLCCPGLLGTEPNFKAKFSKPIEQGKHIDVKPEQKRRSMEASMKLNKIVAPYMLRREKDILRAINVLPEKKELTIWLKMTPLQIKLYEKLLSIADFQIKGAGLAAFGVAKYICNHPLILNPSYRVKSENEDTSLALSYMEQLLQLVPAKEDKKASCKINFALDLVERLLAEKHSILIFSQSRPMLRIMERAIIKELKLDKNRVRRMDGGTNTRDRDGMIDWFQPVVHSPKDKTEAAKKSKIEEPLVFLLTTYVGGVGLNLTNACRVIIIDPAENPSNDNQSVDRAYRIGQKSNVIVYRILTCGTAEESIYRNQVLKGELSVAGTGKEQCRRNLSRKVENVLTLPRKGYGISVTNNDLVKLYGKDFEPNISEEVHLIERNKHVFAVSDHSILFPMKENLPSRCEAESSQSGALRCNKYYKKKDPDIGIRGIECAKQLAPTRRQPSQDAVFPKKETGCWETHFTKYQVKRVAPSKIRRDTENCSIARNLPDKQELTIRNQLPDKQDLTVWLTMTPLQRRLYKELLTIVGRKTTRSQFADSRVAKIICNHPWILKSHCGGKSKKTCGYMEQLLQLIPDEPDMESSCKFTFTIYLLAGLLKEKHNTLIFSESQHTLRLLETAIIKQLGLDRKQVRLMDSSTTLQDRNDMLKWFQPTEQFPQDKAARKCRTEDPMVFLMTTYAGGASYNLTNACRVIIIDPAENPSHDKHNVDHAYQTGQCNDVIVYRLVTYGTIEELTYRHQLLKGEVAGAVTGKGECNRGMPNDILTPLEHGFGMPVTHSDLVKFYGDDFELNIRNKVCLIEKHDQVLAVTNHSLSCAGERAENSTPNALHAHSLCKVSYLMTLIGRTSSVPRL